MTKKYVTIGNNTSVKLNFTLSLFMKYNYTTLKEFL